MKLSEIKRKSDELEAQIKQLQVELKNTIIAAINEAAEGNPYHIKKLGANCFIIKSSQMIGRPWSPAFYDWEKSAQFLVEILENRDVTKWVSTLEGWLESAKGYVVEIKQRKYYRGCCAYEDYTTPIDKAYLEKVIEIIEQK